MGGAASVLSPRRAAALVALAGAVVVWDAIAETFPDAPEWVDVTLAAAVLMPVTLAVAWAALPLAGARGVLALAIALGAAAWALDTAGLEGLFNVAKLLAFVLFGYWFLDLFEELAWVVLVALIVPWADIVSVAAGPTKVIVEERPGLFERISIAFPVSGEDASANLGPPDVIFLALFLAAAARFGLRVWATFACVVALLGLTLVIAVAGDLGGLPALPAVSLGLLLPNADLLWRRVRTRRAAA